MKKAAFIDVDGTLTHGMTSWQKAHHHFNVVDEMKAHTRQFFNGKITYDEWAMLDVGLWRGRPITELHNALNPPNLVEGAKLGVQNLQDKGYDVILISGGINMMVDEVMRLTGADEAYSNIIGETDGLIDGTISETVGVKADVIKNLQQKRGYDLRQSIAIGDHINDVEMFEMVGKSIAVNPKSEKLEQIASIVLHESDFSTVVKKALTQ